MYKTYRFALYNWKRGDAPMWIYRDFPSAYAAATHADRISFRTPGSQYFVVFSPEYEKPVGYVSSKDKRPKGWRRSA